MWVCSRLWDMPPRARLRDFKVEDEAKGAKCNWDYKFPSSSLGNWDYKFPSSSEGWEAFDAAGATVFAPHLGRLTALTALRCGLGKSCVVTLVHQCVAMAVIGIRECVMGGSV
jgi:hypothetical protein